MIERIVEIQLELSRQMSFISKELDTEHMKLRGQAVESAMLRSRLSVLEDVSYLIAGKFEDELEEYLVSRQEEK